MPAPFDLEERMRLWNEGPIAKFLPIEFPEHEAKWEHITGYCAQCKKEIPDNMMHGEAVQTFKNIYHVKMVGYCRACKLVTCFDWHVKPDGISGKDDKGNWVNYTSRPGTLLGKFKEFFKKRF